MPNWKKVITSGSDARLNAITMSGNIIPDQDNVHSLGTSANRFQLNGGTPVTVTGSGTTDILTRFNGSTEVENSTITNSDTLTTVRHTNDGNQIFIVSGSNGELLSVTDEVGDELLRVNDTSGIGVFIVSSSGTLNAERLTASTQDFVLTYNSASGDIFFQSASIIRNESGILSQSAQIADDISGSLSATAIADLGARIVSGTATQVRSFLNVENGATADQTGTEIATALNNEDVDLGTGNISASNIQVADQIVHTGDTDTYITFPSANNIDLYAAGELMLAIDSSKVVINEAGGNNDFRVESNNNANMLFVDGGNDRVGIGTNLPATVFDAIGEGGSLTGTSFYYNGRFKDTDNAGVLLGHNSTANGVGMIAGINELAFLTYDTSWGEKMRIDSSGNVGINKTAPTHTLEVKGNTADTFAVRIDADYTSGQSYGLRVRGGTNEVDSSLLIEDVSGNDLLKVLGNGNVGIGESSPSAKLDIYSDIDEVLRLEASASNGSPYVSFFQNDTRRSFIQHQDTSDNLAVVSEYGGIRFLTGTNGTNEVQRYLIDSTGNHHFTGSLNVSGSLTADSATVENFTINDTLTADTITGSLLRLSENGTGLRLTNVGGFEPTGSNVFNIFGNNNVIFKAGGSGDSHKVLTLNQTSKDVEVENAVSASEFSGSFVGDGSGLTGLTSANDATVTLTPGAGIGSLGSFTTNQSSNQSITIGVDGILEDLDTLGAPASDGQFIVATGTGAFAYESGATVRTSLGLGTAALSASTDFVAVTGDGMTGNLLFNDSVEVRIGTGADTKIYHNGTNTYIDNYTNDLYIQNQANDKDILFLSDDGSGGLATYMYLDGSIVETRFAKASRHNNNIKAKFGDSTALEIYHNGTNAFLDNNLGHVYIRNNVDGDDGSNIYIQAKSGENSIIANDDGEVQLYHDNSLKLATKAGGVDITGDLGVSGTVTANKIVTNVVSQSILLTTGSNIFGDEQVDTHAFTGSVSITGSLNIDGGNSLQFDGVNTLSTTSTYTKVHNPESSIAIYLGDSGDRTNYYDNNEHRFRNAGGGSILGRLDSTRLLITGEVSGSTLDIAGGAEVEYLDVATSIRHQGDLNNYITFGPDSQTFYTAGTSRLSIGSTGTATFNTDDVRIGQYLYHNGDTNTYLRFQDDVVDLYAGGTRFLTAFESTQDVLIVNEGGADVDFRVESNNNANMLFVDGGNDRVGIGTSSPNSRVHISGSNTAHRTLEIEDNTPAIYFNEADGTEGYHLSFNGSTMYFLRDSDGDGSYDSIDGSISSGNWNFNNSIYVGSSIRHKDDTDNYLLFGTDTQTYYTNGSERFKISSAGVRSTGLISGSSLDISGNSTLTGDVTLEGIAEDSGEATALFIDGSNQVKYRELGSNAFNSTAFATGDNFDADGTFASLRAQGTTKADVGLGNVPNSDHTAQGYATGDNFDADGTFASLRAQGTTKADVGLGNVANTTISVTSTSVSDGTNTFNKFDGAYSSLSGTPTIPTVNNATLTLSPGAGIAAIGNFTANQSSNETLTIGVDGVLQDLDTLGAPTTDGQFIVATGAGAFAYESAGTARTSLGLGSAATAASTDFVAVSGDSMTGNLIMGNNNISNINALSFNDPGPDEGISWTGGNFKIYESPDDLTTNTKGNLQIVSGSTRVATFGAEGETALYVEGSGSTVFEVQGSEGQLFSVTDDLSGDIFTVSDISGIPIFTVNADGSGSLDGQFTVEGHLSSSTADFTSQIQIDDHVIKDSSDRTGLLEIDNNASAGTWSGIQVTNDSGQLWSFMGNNVDAGLYDDTQGEWALLYNINGSVELYHNGSKKIETTSGGVAVTGAITATGDITAYYSSDKRLKENIKPIENATDKVKKIGGYEFDWKKNDDPEMIHEGHDIGVIAQEVEEVLPEIVTDRENGYKAVEYHKLVALLIESNKELAARVEELENKLK